MSVTATEAMTASGVREEPLFFESGGEKLFGILHLPPAADSAFVFVHPFAEEKKCAHRIFVDMARALADVGAAVLRFDLFGCGDSTGDFGDATFEAWRQNTDDALNTAAERAGVEDLGILGLRLGGAVACRAAAEDDRVRRLVLWEPTVDGNQYMRLNMTRRKLRQALTEEEGEGKVLTAAAPEPESGIDYDGYLVSDVMQEGITGIDLLKEPLPDHCRRALILQISTHTRPTKLLEELTAHIGAGDRNTEFALLREQPIWSLLDLKRCDELVAGTVRWAQGGAFGE